MHSALIVGAGTSGFLHALALRSAGVAITAVFDPDRERARDLAEVTGATPCDDIASFSGDIVAICSPPRHHVAQAELLARPDRLTFLEKPVAVGASELGRLAGLPNVVPIVQWRAGQAAHALRSAFAADLFGARPHVVCELRLWRDEAYLRRTASWDIDALLSIGIHAVDLVLSATRAPIRSAVCRSERLRGELEVELTNGVTARIRIALDAPGHDGVRVAVHGPTCSAELCATEADPTAAPLVFRDAAPPPPGGATGSPLLVPFVHDTLVRFARGAPMLGIADVARAHTLLF